MFIIINTIGGCYGCNENYIEFVTEKESGLNN